MREMRNSGVEWIGYVPVDWQTLTIGSLFNVRNEKVNDTDYQPLSVSKGGIVPQMENVAKTDANDNRKKVLVNDFVINSRSDRKQSCGVSPLNGSVSLINTVLCPIPNAPIVPAYLNYLLKNYGFAEEFYRWGHGIVADLWTTRWQEMKSILLPIPCIEEQHKILESIEDESNRIDLLISNVQEQIEKLKAYKQSLITEVVTRGLDPTVSMKDSGVAWIGKIPAHWEIKRTKHLADTLLKGNGITKEDIVDNGDTPCVRYGEIYSKYSICFESCITRTNLSKVPSAQYFEHGDILFAGTGELVEEIGKNIVYLGTGPCLAGGDIIVMKHSQDPLFMSFSLNSTIAQAQKSCSKAKLKVVHISATDIGNVLVPVPPIDEQKHIASFLATKCDQIDRLIRIKNEKISRLEQYKKSLIYEYVTGKKEVL